MPDIECQTECQIECQIRMPDRMPDKNVMVGITRSRNKFLVWQIFWTPRDNEVIIKTSFKEPENTTGNSDTLGPGTFGCLCFYVFGVFAFLVSAVFASAVVATFAQECGYKQQLWLQMVQHPWSCRKCDFSCPGQGWLSRVVWVCIASDLFSKWSRMLVK